MANTNGPGKFFKNRKKKKKEEAKKEYLEDVKEYFKKNPRTNPFPPAPFEKKELGGTIGDAPMKKDKMMTGGSLRRKYSRPRGI